ncbi:MAG: sigma-70 family RNA polymerase sigma factor [Anaerolineae bacterium]|nr:sigma-70 family RNA polymerase sigma factor [Anaerolineae bacterium]
MQAVETKPNKQRHSPDSTSDQNLAGLFQDYYPRIYSYLRYRVNAVEDAEDLIGIVFERAYIHRDQFDLDKGSFSTWLFRIAHNTLANFYRTHERRSAWESGSGLPPDLMTPEPSPESQLVQKETLAQLLQGIEHLSERDQEIISLKFAGRLGNKEIGEIMDLKEKTVSVVLLRAVRRLRQYMIEEEAAQ